MLKKWFVYKPSQSLIYPFVHLLSSSLGLHEEERHRWLVLYMVPRKRANVKGMSSLQSEVQNLMTAKRSRKKKWVTQSKERGSQEQTLFVKTLLRIALRVKPMVKRRARSEESRRREMRKRPGPSICQMEEIQRTGDYVIRTTSDSPSVSV